LILEILVIILLIIANGIFSMAEMAVVSARKALLKQNAEEGDAATVLRSSKGANQFYPHSNRITLVATLRARSHHRR
jgi:putative hemolysin